MKKEHATNAIFAALSKLGEKNSDRDLIPSGDYTVKVNVSAKCDRYLIDESFDLKLHVADESQQSRTVKIKPEEVLGLIFDLFGKSSQDKLTAALADNETASDESRKAAALFLKQSAGTKKTTVRGAVTLAVE